jgi:hypothetical protein
LSDAATSRLVSESELAGATAATAAPDTNYVLSIDYKSADFGGSTFTWYQTTTCGSFQQGSMPSGWNDVISSVAAYSGCATTLFHDSNFGQPTYLITVNGNAAHLGDMNDQTSSQKWCHIYPCG